MSNWRVMVMCIQVLLKMIGFVGMMVKMSLSAINNQDLLQNEDVVVVDMKIQLSRIERYLDFLENLTNGDTKDVADWFLSSERSDPWASSVRNQLVVQRDLIRNDIRNNLKKFPFYQINEKIRSLACKKVLFDIQDSNDISKLSAYLKVLGNKELTQLILIEIKDLACLTYLFYVYFAGLCSKQCTSNKRNSFWTHFMPHQDNALMNLLYAYNTIDKLPVENVISSIDTFVQEFTQMLAALQSTDDNNGESINANSSFAGWLKEKWVLLPLAVGVIIIKTVYYFWAKEKEKDGINTSFMQGIPFNLK